METRLRPGIDWVGYVDWTVRDFHGYDTHRGTTYNAYLIRDERTALIDAVKAPYADELLANISAICEPASLDYVVCNHAEPDHSGALPKVMAVAPRAALVCDEKCRVALSQHYDTSAWRFQIVANGQSLSLGQRTLRFIETPMVHWPESMFTYVPEERLLFSMDAFGQHYASSSRFDDQSPGDLVWDEARTYYANIVMPYGGAVGPCLDKAAGLTIETIAPSHGVIWRRDPAKIVEAYRRWCAGRCQPRVLVIYDTMWGSTEQMGQEILHGAASTGIAAELIHLRSTSLTRIAAEVLDAGGVALGCSTLNRGMLPSAAAAVHYLLGLRPKCKVGLAFGSYGWGPGGPEALQAAMRELSWEIIREPLRARYRPSPELLAQCRQAGAELAAGAMRLAAAAD